MSICLSIIVNERDVVWVGRATRRWQPKTTGIWWGDRLVVESFKQKYGFFDGYTRSAIGSQ